MKIKVVVSLAVAIMSIANVAYADITIRSSTLNACPNMAGNWLGQGNLSNWALKCGYHGSGHISSLDGAGRFTMTVSVDKDSGSLVCPKHVSVQLPGSCNDGVLSINTTFGSIRGNLNGNAGTASGKMTVSPGIVADVKAQIRKVS